jgi:hypothetical protein
MLLASRRSVHSRSLGKPLAQVEEDELQPSSASTTDTSKLQDCPNRADSRGQCLTRVAPRESNESRFGQNGRLGPCGGLAFWQIGNS